jgi:putative SbcD/Mre11-related phosphoesterase
MNEIIPGITIVDLSLFLGQDKILVFGDVHIGIEEALQKEGVLLPKFHFKDLRDKLEKVLDETKPSIVIINGDMKHEFGTISDEEWRNTLKLIDLIQARAKLVLIKGNHDTILEPIAKKRELDIRNYYAVKDLYICHGHKLPGDNYFKDSKKLIISHDHPAVTLKDDNRVEKFKCFLLGKWQDKDVVVLPAFSPMSSGSDIMQEKIMSPLIEDVGSFRAFVVEEGRTYDFGLVKELNKKIQP